MKKNVKNETFTDIIVKKLHLPEENSKSNLKIYTHKHIHGCCVHLNDVRIVCVNIWAHRIQSMFRFSLFISLLQNQFWLL